MECISIYPRRELGSGERKVKETAKKGTNLFFGHFTMINVLIYKGIQHKMCYTNKF